MREMVAAGRYYGRNEAELRKEIAAYYESERGPAALPVKRPGRNAIGIIAPDSTYPNAGPCMAWSYKALAESPLADVYIIIAAGDEPGLTVTTFQTPLGIVRVDQELARALAVKGTLVMNEQAHARAHGVEVQLPFLQLSKEADAERITILPVLVTAHTDLRQFAIDLKEACIELKRNAFLIASAGFVHYGPLFKYVPFAGNVAEQVAALDKELLDRVKDQDADGFADTVAQKMIRMPGAPAVELLLRTLQKCEALLEQYYTSGEVLDDWRNSVSYAAVVFEQ